MTRAATIDEENECREAVKTALARLDRTRRALIDALLELNDVKQTLVLRLSQTRQENRS